MPTLTDPDSDIHEAEVARFVNLFLGCALADGASVIHVEPTARDLRIMVQLGKIHSHMPTAPRSIAAAVTTCLKVLAGMDIAEHRRPQDGRIALPIGGKEIDLTVASAPTSHGEKIVLRVVA